MLLLCACTAREAAAPPSASPIRASLGSLGTSLTPVANDSFSVLVDGDSTRRLRFSPVSAADAARARLCGYIVAEPTAALRVPLPPGMDTTAPRILLDYLRGSASRGLRYIVPGFRAHYIYAGLTADGRYRIDYRQPVRLLPTANGAPPPPDSLTQYIEPSLEQIDAFVHSARLRDALPAPPMRGVLPDSLSEPELAVPDIRELPDAPLLFDGACPSATLGTLGIARIERIFRARIPAGHTLHARARSSIGGIVLSVDYPAVPDSARRNVKPVQHVSVVAAEDRDVTLRVLFAPVLRKEPDQAFVTISVALTRSDSSR
jgi:hypothetical protein